MLFFQFLVLFSAPTSTALLFVWWCCFCVDLKIETVETLETTKKPVENIEIKYNTFDSVTLEITNLHSHVTKKHVRKPARHGI